MRKEVKLDIKYKTTKQKQFERRMRWKKKRELKRAAKIK